LIVVSDTSPVLNLARIERLEILQSLYQQVLIPPAVSEELSTLMAASPRPWLMIAVPADKERVRELCASLDLGEAEAIVLAVERSAELLLIDERRGRQTALALGLKITGLLGVLADAKRAGLIGAVKPVLDELIQTARFWIGPDLYREVLLAMGEL
jgi:predicted nucleic acid-binding protein